MKTRIVTMLAGLMALSLITTAFGAAANFPELMSAANEAAGKGEFDAALANFNSAFQTADTQELKAQAYFARESFLVQNKKYDAAEKLAKEYLQDEPLPPLVRRKVLVSLAGWIKFGRPYEANQYLNQAITIPSTDVYDLVNSSGTMGYIYQIRKQPEYALDAWLPIMEMRDAHPAHHSMFAYEIGQIYQQLGDLENARKYFQLSVDYGKKVQYKFDYSDAEIALEKLKTENK